MATGPSVDSRQCLYRSGLARKSTRSVGTASVCTASVMARSFLPVLHTLQNLSSTSRVRSVLVVMTEARLGEQPPTLLRRHAAGTDSARSVLFTVLGELVLRTGGGARTSRFIDVVGRLGVAEKAARQAPLGTLVGQAWDLGQLTREYDEFIEAFGGQVTPLSPDPLVRVIDLVHAWRRFPWIDPGLPAQFLPAPWHGTAAAGLFARLHAEWTD